MTEYWFEFPTAVTVPSAADPEKDVTIPAGTWLVRLEELVTKANNSSECTVVQPNISEQRILRTTLNELADDGRAIRK